MSYRITLTDFVDIVSKSGNEKANKIKKVLTREEYHPAKDFYRRLREGIISYHKQGLSKSDLRNLTNGITNKSKLKYYPLLIEKYISWLGRKKMEWLEPANSQLQHDEILLHINPELGLKINGKEHLIKLYFKSDPLSKNKIDIITHLMAVELNEAFPDGITMSVLDISKGKLISPSVPIATLNASLQGELAYISAFASNLKKIL